MKEKNILGNIVKILTTIFLILPLAVSIVYSFAGQWTSILPKNLTLRFYVEQLTNTQFLTGILRGIVISIIPVVLVNAMILLTLFAVIVYFPKMEKYIQICCIIPTTINGIILATAILSTYSGSSTIFSNRIIMLIFVYCVFCLPVTYQGIRNSLYAVNTKTLLEASSILGANEFYGFVKIIVPTVMPNIMNTVLISFSGLFGDFALIKIIASSQYETVQTYLYKNRNTKIQLFCAGVAILLILTMIINLMVHKIASKKCGQTAKEETEE